MSTLAQRVTVLELISQAYRLPGSRYKLLQN